jgi:hypothetical protein
MGWQVRRSRYIAPAPLYIRTYMNSSRLVVYAGLMLPRFIFYAGYPLRILGELHMRNAYVKSFVFYRRAGGETARK